MAITPRFGLNQRILPFRIDAPISNAGYFTSE